MADFGKEDLAVNPPGSRYPFYSPSSDIDGLFADAWVYHHYRDFQPPLSLYYLQGFAQGPESDSSLSSSANSDNTTYVIVKDAAGVTVFDGSRGDYEFRSWSSQFDVHEWKNEQGICRLLRDRTVDCANTIHPVAAVLDTRTYVYQPDRIDGIVINNLTITDGVQLQNGFNTTLLAATPSSLNERSPTAITLAATPGSGEGVFFGCGVAANYVSSINSATPNEVGDVAVTGEECTWIKPGFEYGSGDVATPEEGALRIGDECQVCCECDDYYNTHEAWRTLHRKFHLMGDDVEAFRQQYVQVLARWAALAACGQATPVRLELISPGANMLVISVTAVNWRSTCENLKVTLDTVATQWQGGAVIPYGGVLVSDPDGRIYNSNMVGTPVSMSKTWSAVPSRGTVFVKITLQYPTPLAGTSIAVTVTASVTSGGVAAPNSVSKSIQLQTTTTGGIVFS